MARAIRRRELIKLGSATTGMALLVACAPEAAKPSPTPTPGKAGKFELGPLEGPEVITDSSKYPKTFKEAPALADLVKAGKLPSVADRIGQDPIVVKPLQSVGKY